MTSNPLLGVVISALGVALVRDVRADAGTESQPKHSERGSSKAAPPSRALPVTLMAIGGAAVAGGVVGVVVDEDALPTGRPTYRDSATTGVVAMSTGVVVGGLGGYLLWRSRDKFGGETDHAVVGNHSGRWMLWSGLGMIGGATASGALWLKFALDAHDADDNLGRTCAQGCTAEEGKVLRDARDRAYHRSFLALGGAGICSVGALVFLTLWDRDRHGQPTVQVSAAGASVGWAASF